MPRTFSELLVKIEKYANVEEATRSAAPRPTNVAEMPQHKFEKRPHPNHSADNRPKRPRFNFDDYTKLNAPMDKIMDHIQNEAYFRWPAQLKPGEGGRDREAKCKYHRGMGHKTQHCQSLRVFLEKLIQQGHLQQFIANPAPTGADKPGTSAGEKSQLVPHAVVNVLHGRPMSRAQEKKQERAHKRNENMMAYTGKRQRQYDWPHDAEVKFNEADLKGVKPHHSNALVITLIIANHEVKRILVDNGSTSEILFLSTFRKMNLPEASIQRCPVPIVGFDGKIVHAIGQIALTVVSGPIAEIMTFLVVDTPSSYNAILGRTWLHRLRAVPSTYHQMLKIPVEGGSVQIRGDQQMAEYCYSIAYDEAQKSTNFSAEPKTALPSAKPPLPEANPTR